MHLSDLHIGRRLGELPLIEDQKYILEQILQAAEEEKPDAALIAGDVYDKSMPPAEAVAVFDEFIVSLSKLCPQVFIISGNHDSGMRLAFGNRLMTGSGVHFSSVFDGTLQRTQLEDGFGKVSVWMLPFIKPAHVRQCMETAAAERAGTEMAEEQTSTEAAGEHPAGEAVPADPEQPEEAGPELPGRDDYTGALRIVIESAEIDPAERNILVAHQYVTGGIRSESEEKNLGGLDNVDAEVFEPFDYVALGHLHRAQKAGGEHIRYCGAPLRYSFMEAEEEKQILIAELGEKGDLQVRSLPLKPLREMRILRGSFDELMTRSFYENTDYQKAFVRAELTDGEFIPEGIRRLRTVYRNILEISYGKLQTERAGEVTADPERQLSPSEYLADFYRAMRGKEMNEDQTAFAEEVIREIWEEEA